MTKIRLREVNDGWLLTCEGHAGYGEAGKDIVCAGISALCMALTRRLEEMSLEGAVQLVKHASPGEFSLRAEVPDGDRESEVQLKSAIDTVYEGFCALKEAYPAYISIS